MGFSASFLSLGTSRLVRSDCAGDICLSVDACGPQLPTQHPFTILTLPYLHQTPIICTVPVTARFPLGSGRNTKLDQSALAYSQ